MKKSKFSVIVAVLALFTVGSLTYVSCNKESEAERAAVSEKADSKKASPSGMVPKSGGGLGYVDENNVFRPIADAWVKDYYRAILQIGDKELENPVIVNETDPETGEPAAYLKTSSKDGTLRITDGLDRYGETYYTLQGISCTCTTEACAQTNGCTASVFAGNCYCSSCPGDCKKSSTATSRLFIQQFFNVYYALGN